MTKFDDMAWAQIHARPVPKGVLAEHYGLKISGRPASFPELEQMIQQKDDFVLAFCMFLDEFYLFRRAEFFATEPTVFFDAKTRAWLAGVVEYLCHRFGLAVPEWVEKPEFFLSTPWKKSHDDTGEPEFKRRNVFYNPRHLTRL